MSFAARISRTPIAFDADRGAEALLDFPRVDMATADLLRGTAGCSPYLAGLMSLEKDWLLRALNDPEAAVSTVLAALPASSVDTLSGDLRQAKRRIALITALADLGGVWSLEHVTQVLTDFADASVQACVTLLVGAEVKRGRLPSGGNPAEAGGMVVLAMGKMGAAELNYSSDIDLICLFDETRFDPDDYHEVRAAFIRVTRRMTAILSDVTEGGYVFRTDLRLRPDASVTPVCLSMEAAERYYESVGRTWERAAYIKARPCAGDVAAGNRFLETLRPFVWRKHLDFAAIQDAHDMRLKIRDHKGLHGELTLDGHNMKLGRGGIREIEFFTQTRQLIAGGRDPSLRVRETGQGLDRLAAAGWVPSDTAAMLYDHYRFHREVEHRLQMINDAQTHQLPSDQPGFDRLAALMGRTKDDLRSELQERLEAVHARIEGFFAPEPTKPVASNWGQEVTRRWATYPALRSARASQIFDRLAPEIIARLRGAAKPEEALAQFDGFLSGLPAGVQLFSLFEANPSLTQLIVDIASTSPALAQYLSRNAGVLDAVIGGAFFAPWPGKAGLIAELEPVLRDAGDYEAKLVAARRWAKEWHFRIGVHHLRSLIDAETSGTQYADLAGAVVAGLWPVITADFATKHGDPPGRGAAIIGMGSLGASRLHAASDVDLIVIYDAQGVDHSAGRRPLATRAYYARLTQALVTALNAPMSEGRLYDVDMRLRPSGRQGPVATSFNAFKDYQMTEAWTWEHLALTRACPLAGPQALQSDIEQVRQDVLLAKSKGVSVVADVADMRTRLAEAKPNTGGLDAKSGAGYLQDIELLVQMLALRSGSPARDMEGQLSAGVVTGQISAADAATLATSSRLFFRMQATLRLLLGGTGVADGIGEGGRQMLLRETGHETMGALTDDALAAAADSRECIDRQLRVTDGG